jgi:hypothetical protein
MKQIWGYHIVTRVGLPQRLLASGGKYCFGGDALLFMTEREAAEYMKEHEISSEVGCIVDCECSEFLRKTHVLKE